MRFIITAIEGKDEIMEAEMELGQEVYLTIGDQDISISIQKK